MEYLSLQNLSKTYPNLKGEKDLAWFLDDINLNVDHGDILALLGPSGCGKTTLLRLITGLESLDKGSIILNGKNITNVPTHSRFIGMMFQDYALFPHKTVSENIAFGLKIDKQLARNRAKISERIEEVLKLVNLSKAANRYIQDLSGGEKQRVALARTLAPKPKLILLDEPLGSLDRALREELMFELRDILKKTQMTAVFVTHDQTEAFSIADKIAVMDKGRLIQHDDTEKLYLQPLNKKVASFLGFKNLFDGVVGKQSKISSPIGDLTVPEDKNTPGKKLVILIRPEVAVVCSNEKEINLEKIKVMGKVIRKTFLGGYYQVSVRLENNEILCFKFQNKIRIPEPGNPIELLIEPSQIEFIQP